MRFDRIWRIRERGHGRDGVGGVRKYGRGRDDVIGRSKMIWMESGWMGSFDSLERILISFFPGWVRGMCVCKTCRCERKRSIRF